MSWLSKKDDVPEKGGNKSPQDTARLTNYARTRAVQENEILGHHYWEMHKELESDLWKINRVEISEKEDKNNPGTMDVFRTIKPQFYHLSFFDAIKQMADFENYLTVSTAEYINETIEELSDEHYIHVAEQEGFIVFEASSKRPAYAPNGHIPEAGEFRESDLKRAFARAAAAKEKHPEMFERRGPVSMDNNLLSVAVPQSLEQIKEILSIATTFKYFEYMSEMDDLMKNLTNFSSSLQRAIKKPVCVDYEGSRTYNFSRAYELLRLAGKSMKAVNVDEKSKEELLEFLKKIEANTHIVEIQSWNKLIKENNVNRHYSHEKHVQSVLTKAVKYFKKQGVDEMTENMLKYTLGQERPENPSYISDFVYGYENWKSRQLDSLQKNKVSTERVGAFSVRML